MDFWASLEHKIYYKFDGQAPEHIRRELKECADITAFLDRKMLALNEEIQNYRESVYTQQPGEVVNTETKEALTRFFGIVVEDCDSVESMDAKDESEQCLDQLSDT